MTTSRFAHFDRIPTKALVAVVAITALVLLLLYLQGTIGSEKVAPGRVTQPAAEAPRAVVVAEKREVPDLVDWPGTVRSHSVANVAPKVMARILEVRVSAGDTVKTGDIIAVLDDRDVTARADQARSALAAAEAQATQAESDRRRNRLLFDKQAATQQDRDAAEARAKATAAQVTQARRALDEMQVLLGETVVRAPFDGVVAQRLVDPGDTAAPGKPIAVVHDPHALRLEVTVADRCTEMISVGMTVLATIEAPAREMEARIDEIAPASDPQSRTVLVKAALPAQTDLRPGTFGSLRTPCGSHIAVLIPAAAVSRTGQLEAVRLAVDGDVRTRNIRTGKLHGDRVEVLSGLQEGDRVVLQ